MGSRSRGLLEGIMLPWRQQFALIYRKASAIRAFQGSLKFSIMVDSQGKVILVEVVVNGKVSK